ncbi:MAG: indole-3-glycerol-phosphate synthase, partial [Thaumarchaeota archaeon]|nr:indole-3-glycerol-phosphate synthase [Nitrososphaerota archaeon]
RKAETNFIFTLASSARQNIADGYYHGAKVPHQGLPGRRSLKESILRSKLTPVIAEIKFTSPAEGRLRPTGDVAAIAEAYQRGGVSGISVLTEPRHFEGDIRYLPIVKKAVDVPVLMKDIIVDPLQIDAGADMGADAVLLIAGIFINKLANASLDEMLARAHALGLEVLLEAHTEEEYKFALDSSADLIGINNRNLDTLKVSLETSRTLLVKGRAQRRRLSREGRDKPVVSESGITNRAQIDELRSLGADAVLIGSALMKSTDLQAKVRSLTGAK